MIIDHEIEASLNAGGRVVGTAFGQQLGHRLREF